MTQVHRDVPDTVLQAAGTAWKTWSDKLAAVRPAGTAQVAKTPRPGPRADALNAEEKMIRKIRRRMQQYPEWYEATPSKVSATVCAELNRIGMKLARDLPGADKPIEVWRVPLSVFNWLVERPGGRGFVRGALKAWPCAQCFNAASNNGADPAEKARLRAPFLEIAPPVLKAVLDQLMREDLKLSFAQGFEGSELRYLSLRVELP